MEIWGNQAERCVGGGETWGSAGGDLRKPWNAGVMCCWRGRLLGIWQHHCSPGGAPHLRPPLHFESSAVQIILKGPTGGRLVLTLPPGVKPEGQLEAFESLRQALARWLRAYKPASSLTYSLSHSHTHSLRRVRQRPQGSPSRAAKSTHAWSPALHALQRKLRGHRRSIVELVWAPQLKRRPSEMI